MQQFCGQKNYEILTYTLAIDWLSVHCHCMRGVWEPSEEPTDGNNLFGRYPFRYSLAEYGTRQFARLHFVAMPNPEGGYDDFAEVQSQPHSGILNRQSVIVRFVNRALYLPDFWELANRFLRENDLEVKGITRIDLCADFNDFVTMSPLALIEGFAAKRFRHVGRGVGALYFDHGVKHGEYGVNYTGLSFGTHSSDARVYLYNKSLELLTVKDKPYIRDTWTAAGLDVRHVWRLEVSIKSKGCHFKCKQSGEKIDIMPDNVSETDELAKIYHTFAAKLFAFVKNRRGITNITREPRIQLLPQVMHYQRAAIRNISSGNKMQRMVIKSLYLLGDLYRGSANVEYADLAQSFAVGIAQSTDLDEWLGEKITEWGRPTHL